MADGKAGEEKPEKPQRAGAAGGSHSSCTATQSQFLLYTLTSSEETVGSVGDSCRGIFLVKMLFEVAAPIRPEEEAEKPVKTKTVSSSNGGESSSRSAEKRSADDEVADLPAKPTKMSKFGFAIGSQTARKASAISIRLGASKPKETVPTLAPKTLSVAAAFNEDEDHRVSLCSPGCPGTHSGRPGWPRTQKSTCLCLPSAGITGVRHHARQELLLSVTLELVFSDARCACCRKQLCGAAESEPEEMPPEAKMRMKNIGRDTPTSAGPNSFNKGKHGFSDNQKLWERNIKSHLGNVHDQDN
ncbi:PEST proteolytic signal-containing nuclear protein [Apodemus speciosus]|uniref:PEST proteolytic signal-containing nuclear protein n=1 Tax=Apodemus speciosus TaxID=105296 RepID=A0ABQ0FMA4_APOSI